MDAVAHAIGGAAERYQPHSTFQRGANSTAVCIFGSTLERTAIVVPDTLRALSPEAVACRRNARQSPHRHRVGYRRDGHRLAVLAHQIAAGGRA